MGEHEFVIKASELSRMELTCPKCGATFAVDGKRKEWGANDAACPACGGRWHGLKDLLGWYRDFYDFVCKSDLAVGFRIKGTI